MNNELQNLERTITSILNRHGFQIKKEDDDSLNIFKSSKNSSSTKNTFIYIGIFIILTSMIILISLDIFERRILMFLGFILFSLITSLNRQKKVFDNLNHEIKIKEGEISITDKNEKHTTYKADDIDEVEIVIPKDKELIFGHINLKGNNIGQVQLIELLADEKKYLEDDLVKIANYISMRM